MNRAAVIFTLVASLPACALLEPHKDKSFIRECLANVDEASNPELAHDHCYWDHWEQMISFRQGDGEPPG